MTFLRKLRRVAGILTIGIASVIYVHAGGSAQSIVGVEKFGADRIDHFTLRVNDALDARRANVAIVARCGRPKSELPKGISYTHVAIAVFEPVRDATGEIYYTYTVYNLYQGEEGRLDRSHLKQDLTYDFVAGVAEPDVAICVPTDELQQRIIRVLRSPTYVALHIPEYNLAANPWVNRFDNCVTHTLKVCVAAIYQTDDPTRIYRNIRAHFQPTPLRFGPLKSLGTHFVDGLSHKDRDPSGLQTASYDSLHGFLERNGLVKDSFVVTLQ